jgi:hypothetical protein
MSDDLPANSPAERSQSGIRAAFYPHMGRSLTAESPRERHHQHSFAECRRIRESTPSSELAGIPQHVVQRGNDRSLAFSRMTTTSAI